MSVRLDTDVAPFRRFVNRMVIDAMRDVFSNSYDRERQFQNLKVTLSYPLKKVDFPAIVVEFTAQHVQNAGVAHREWFQDVRGILREWHHNWFTGSLEFTILGLSPLDRDLMADAVIEVVRFGRLDSQLLKFFHAIYGQEDAPFELHFTQLAVNADEIDLGGNSASPAPWGAEDVLVYTTSATVNVHGGYYNVFPSDTWQYVTSVDLAPYPQGELEITLNYRPDVGWSNPFVYQDSSRIRPVLHISAAES